MIISTHTVFRALVRISDFHIFLVSNYPYYHSTYLLRVYIPNFVTVLRYYFDYYNIPYYFWDNFFRALASLGFWSKMSLSPSMISINLFNFASVSAWMSLTSFINCILFSFFSFSISIVSLTRYVLGWNLMKHPILPTGLQTSFSKLWSLNIHLRMFPNQPSLSAFGLAVIHTFEKKFTLKAEDKSCS